MVNPKVHLLSDEAACIAYVRLTQYLDKYVIILSCDISDYEFSIKARTSSHPPVGGDKNMA